MLILKQTWIYITERTKNFYSYKTQNELSIGLPAPTFPAPPSQDLEGCWVGQA